MALFLLTPFLSRKSFILSGAKHLQYLVENKQMQILRFPQDDSRGEFFRSL